MFFDASCQAKQCPAEPRWRALKIVACAKDAGWMTADEVQAIRRRVPDRCQRSLTPDVIDSPGQQADAAGDAAQSLHQAVN
ncbi:hypothetical protein Q4543_19075 [Salipiger sp. 1_MG-2023]|nr:hypothetical protein [Salipiger sp. 1_MG-2023]